MDIKLYQGITMGSGDADPTLLCSSRIKGFQGSLCRTSLSDTSCTTRIVISEAKKNSLNLVLTYMDNSSKYKITKNT